MIARRTNFLDSNVYTTQCLKLQEASEFMFSTRPKMHVQSELKLKIKKRLLERIIKSVMKFLILIKERK